MAVDVCALPQARPTQELLRRIRVDADNFRRPVVDAAVDGGLCVGTLDDVGVTGGGLAHVRDVKQIVAFLLTSNCRRIRCPSPKQT